MLYPPQLHRLDPIIRPAMRPRPVLRAVFALGIVALYLSGCAAVGPDYRKPDTPLPVQWEGTHDERVRDAGSMARWWQQFHDPVLDGLIADALSANLDLATARAKLREVRAQRDVAQSGLWPSVTAGVGASRSGGSSETGSGATNNWFNASFDASWELDVFGGTRRGLEAADADVQASEETLRDTRVSLVAEVARNYVELRTGEQRLIVAEANLASQKETYDLTRWRQQAGLVTALDEAQALTQLETTQAALPALDTAIAESRYRLAILLGHAPEQFAERLSAGGAIPVASDTIAVGIPADILRQRPDVRAAERNLAAQTARLGEAEAARYPSFKLTGLIGVESLAVNRLLNGSAGTSSVLAGITAPIFDAGRIRSTIAVQDARLKQSLLNYQAAVLTALEEVENALVSLANSRRRLERLTRATNSARLALEIARNRYEAGLADFQSVLESQRALLVLEDQQTSGTGNTSNAQIQLYKALGGGWTPEAESASIKEPS